MMSSVTFCYVCYVKGPADGETWFIYARAGRGVLWISSPTLDCAGKVSGFMTIFVCYSGTWYFLRLEQGLVVDGAWAWRAIFGHIFLQVLFDSISHAGRSSAPAQNPISKRKLVQLAVTRRQLLLLQPIESSLLQADWSVCVTHLLRCRRCV